MTINEIAERAFKHAESKGFYGKDPELEIIEKIKEESKELIVAIGQKLHADVDTFLEFGSDKEKFAIEFGKQIKNTVGDEIADNILMLLAASRKMNIDIVSHLELKQRYNELREDHNGRKKV